LRLVIMGFLKPGKANVGGTLALLAANFIGGSVSGALMPLVFSIEGSAGGQGGRNAGGYGGSFAGGGGQFGGFGLESGALNLIVLALLFYVAISLVIGFLVEQKKS
jgi:hypothetical protein